MPTFRDINQFNAVADTEVNPDWTLQVSATQRVTLKQIVDLYTPKNLIIKVGETLKSYNTKNEVSVDINPSSIGAANKNHTHNYDQITGNLLSFIFDTGINKIGIENYTGGKLNKEISTLELMGLNVDKPYLTEILNNTGFHDPYASGLLVNYKNDHSILGITNQELFLRIPFDISVEIPSNHLTTKGEMGYSDTLEIDISELDPFFKFLFTQIATPSALGGGYIYEDSPIISKVPRCDTSILIPNQYGDISRPYLIIHIRAVLHHVSIEMPIKDKLTLSIFYGFYNSGDYTEGEDDSFSGGGTIDIRVPIADLISKERANFVESTIDDIEV